MSITRPQTDALVLPLTLPGVPLGWPALCSSSSTRQRADRPRRGLLQPHHALSGQTNGRATRHPAFCCKRCSQARLQLNEAPKGQFLFFLNLMKVWTALWLTSGVVSRDESLVSPSICPFGLNKALSAVYVVYSMKKNNLKLTNKDFVSHNLHNTNKLSVVSGIKCFNFFILVCHDSVLQQLSFHRMCIFQYTTAVTFVFIVLFMIVLIVNCRPSTLKWCGSTHSVDTEVQLSFHVFGLYSRDFF